MFLRLSTQIIERKSQTIDRHAQFEEKIIFGGERGNRFQGGEGGGGCVCVCVFYFFFFKGGG